LFDGNEAPESDLLLTRKPKLRDTTRTRKLLMSVGFLGIGLFLWGAFGAIICLTGHRYGDTAALNFSVRCGLGGMTSAVGFGLAQIANDVRYRIVPSLVMRSPVMEGARSRRYG
jgi:hypothetical protein